MFAARRAAHVVCCLASAAGLMSGCSSDDAGAAGSSSATASSAAATARAVRHLDPAAFATTIAEVGVVLLDVRTPSEYAAGHLADATNIDMQAGDFLARVGKLDKSASYALYCRTGHRSGIAAEQLTAAGFTTVVDLAGGIVAWSAAGKPVATS